MPWPVSSERERWYGCWVDSNDEYYDMVRGPDGFAWTWLRNVLVRINAKDASVHVVGKIDRLGYPTSSAMMSTYPDMSNCGVFAISSRVPPRLPTARATDHATSRAVCGSRLTLRASKKRNRCDEHAIPHLSLNVGAAGHAISNRTRQFGSIRRKLSMPAGVTASACQVHIVQLRHLRQQVAGRHQSPASD